MTNLVYNVLIAFCWGILAATILGVTAAVAFNDMLSIVFFLGNGLCIAYVLYILRRN